MRKLVSIQKIKGTAPIEGIVMIEIRVGNVLDIKEGIIVHGCNCQGVMGSGIALQVKQRFPDAYQLYKDQLGGAIGLGLGDISCCKVTKGKYIVNALTQEYYGTRQREVDYEAIVSVFRSVADIARELERRTGKKLEIVFPMIGAGLGGGNWEIIKTIIDQTVPDYFTKVLYVLE